MELNLKNIALVSLALYMSRQIWMPYIVREGAYNYSTSRPDMPWERRRERLYQQVIPDVDKPWLNISPGPGGFW